MTTHELKTWPEYFEAVASGAKNFEIRSTKDRTFEVGDKVVLKEWDPATSSYSGRLRVRQITYIVAGAPFLPDRLAVLGLANEPLNMRKHHENDPVAHPSFALGSSGFNE